MKTIDIIRKRLLKYSFISANQEIVIQQKGIEIELSHFIEWYDTFKFENDHIILSKPEIIKLYFDENNRKDN